MTSVDGHVLIALTPLQTDVTKTGSGERGAGSGERGARSGERGAGNGSLGTSCQRKPPQKSKMAVQKNEREKEEDKERNSCLG